MAPVKVPLVCGRTTDGKGKLLFVERNSERVTQTVQYRRPQTPPSKRAASLNCFSVRNSDLFSDF